MHDPTDETIRKVRRLRNTPLQKYIRLTSIVITLMYAGAMYISYRRNILPHLDDPQYQISEDDLAMKHDYITNPFLRRVIDQLITRREARLKAEHIEYKNQVNNIQANKD